MENDWRKWESLKTDYLKSVERELARTDHPRKVEVLADVRNHLEESFLALEPKERTSDRMEDIIRSMGPPEEYAELLSPEFGGVKDWLLGRNFRKVALAMVSAIVVAAVLFSLEVLAGLNLLLFAAIAAVLGWQYKRTRDTGFIWLAVALVIWPIADTGLGQWNGILIDRLAKGEKIGFYPFSLVSKGQITLGSLVAAESYLFQLCKSALILLALTRFYRAKREAT
jgi:hypothetical protein